MLKRQTHVLSQSITPFAHPSLSHFVLIDGCSVDILVACLRISTGLCRGCLQRDASTRALGSDRLPLETI